MRKQQIVKYLITDRHYNSNLAVCELWTLKGWKSKYHDHIDRNEIF